MKKSVFVWVFLALVILGNLLIIYIPFERYYHLHWDVVVHYERSKFFLEHGNFRNMDMNEYFPGAMVYFALLAQSLRIENSFEFYQKVYFFLNILLAVYLAILYRKMADNKAIWIYSLLLLATGPIFLFRFDLLVMILVLLCFYFWKENKQTTSMVFLALATLTKIFPVIFFPYFLIQVYRNKGLEKLIDLTSDFVFSLAGILGFYMIVFRVSIADLLVSWKFLKNVPVNTESIWASLLSLYSLCFKGRMALGSGVWGTYGIASQDTIGPLWFYAMFSFAAVGLVYYLILKKKRIKSVDERFALVLTVTFVLFSRTMHISILCGLCYFCHF